MFDDMLWEAFSNTLSKPVTVGGQPVRAIVLQNAVETDLDTGSSYKSNKTVLIVEPRYKGAFKIHMKVGIGERSFRIADIFNFTDEVRIELVRN